MLATFLVLLREGFEAALILGIIYTYLAKVGARRHFRYATLGALGGALASGLMGVIVAQVSGPLLEVGPDVVGLTVTLVAVLVLTTMTIWMRVHGRAVKGAVEQRMDAALSSQNLWLIASLAFSSVLREGAESVLFIWGLLTQATAGGEAVQAALGGLLGIVAAAALAVALFRGFRRVNLRRFFDVTSVLLLLVAAGLLVTAVGRVQGLGWLPMPGTPLWDTSDWLDDHSLIGSILAGILGYRSRPSMVEAGAYAIYLLAALGIMVWVGRRQPTRVSVSRSHPHRGE